MVKHYTFNSKTEWFIDLRFNALQPLCKLRRLVFGEELELLFFVELILYILHGQLSGTASLTHAVPCNAAVGAERVGACELVDVSRLQLLAILKPAEYRGGEADHLTLKRDQAFLC